jgi:hypothetical protein
VPPTAQNRSTRAAAGRQTDNMTTPTAAPTIMSIAAHKIESDAHIINGQSAGADKH